VLLSPLTAATRVVTRIHLFPAFPEYPMSRFPTRRTLLRGAAVASTLVPATAIAQRAFLRDGLSPELDPAICRASYGESVVLPQKRAVKLTWNATAICTVGVPVAAEKGYFARHNLEVEMVNYAGSTDQLLEAITTAKADAGIGMALRWLKPLEGGFDVKIAAGIHGGCMRLFSAGDSGITKLEQLKGKAIGVTDLAAPDRNFFSIMLHRAGIDPTKDVEWKVFPGDVLPIALKKGEVQAFCQGDPLGWIARERDKLTEVANNLSGDYAHRTCCVLGIRGSLIRQDKPVAAARPIPTARRRSSRRTPRRRSISSRRC
jgi:NitT/TauT family transport system substrate-binding protein